MAVVKILEASGLEDLIVSCMVISLLDRVSLVFIRVLWFFLYISVRYRVWEFLFSVILFDFSYGCIFMNWMICLIVFVVI